MVEKSMKCCDFPDSKNSFSNCFLWVLGFVRFFEKGDNLLHFAHLRNELSSNSF